MHNSLARVASLAVDLMASSFPYIKAGVIPDNRGVVVLVGPPRQHRHHLGTIVSQQLNPLVLPLLRTSSLLPPLPPSRTRSNLHALQTTIEFDPSNGNSTRKEPRQYVSPPNMYMLDRCPTLPGGDADVESSVVVRINGGPIDPAPGPMQCQVRPGSVVRPPWEDREAADWEGG
jgi:hypothetical protein